MRSCRAVTVGRLTCLNARYLNSGHRGPVRVCGFVCAQMPLHQNPRRPAGAMTTGALLWQVRTSLVSRMALVTTAPPASAASSSPGRSSFATCGSESLNGHEGQDQIGA